VPLKRAGKDFRALCPFHHEKTPSFYVVPAKGFYKCFGCGESGDVFTFLMKRGAELPGGRAGAGARASASRCRTRGWAAKREEPNRILYEAIAFADDFFRRMLREDAGSRRPALPGGARHSRGGGGAVRAGLRTAGWRRCATRRTGTASRTTCCWRRADQGERTWRGAVRPVPRTRLIFPIANSAAA
jgi:DNA primase